MINHRVYIGLCLFLHKLCKSYYEDGLSLIPDEEYDRKLRLVQEYEQAHPDKIHKKSPTHKVGSLKENVETVMHMVPMQSLKNALNYEELKDFVEGILTQYGASVTYVLEPKYDGLACDLAFLVDAQSGNGQLVQAATRGDGIEGEDITRNIMLTDIAKTLDLPKEVQEVNVRGELILTKSGFKKINDSLGPKEKPFANPRNAVAGLLRRKRLDAQLAKHIQFFPYEIVGKEYDEMSRLGKLYHMWTWFGQTDSSQNRIWEASSDFDEIIKTIETMHEEIANFDFEVDGIVLKINDPNICKEMGSRANNPRWAIAYKFPPTKVQTIILDFVWQVGRTGENAPVAKVAPVCIGGAEVDSALAYNIELINYNDWRIGDTVDIFRSGEVIPKLGEVYLEKRPADSKPLQIPITCACCGSALEKVGPALYCVNKAGCADQLLYEYDHIFSKEVFDVTGFSEKTIAQIVKKGLVRCAADFFKLTVEDFLSLDGFANTSAVKLHKEFENSKTQPLQKVIQALCIKDVGESTARNIAKTISNIEEFFTSTKESLMEIDDVGSSTAQSILWCLQDPLWLENARALVAQLNIVAPSLSQVIYNPRITDKRFVITGTFPETREHMTRTLQLFGAFTSESVTSKTHYLVAGANPSPNKMEKALKHKVTLLDFSQYQALFN